MEFINCLLHSTLDIGGEAVKIVDLMVVATGLITIFLIMKQSALNFAFAIANSVLLGAQFLFDQKLYASAAMQGLFIILAILGWINWRKLNKEEPRIFLLSNKSRLKWLLILLGLIGVLYFVIVTWAPEDKYPVFDSIATGLSLVAQIFVNKKYLEATVMWSLVALYSIPNFYMQGLAGPAILYIVFLLASLAGFYVWLKTYRGQGNNVPV